VTTKRQKARRKCRAFFYFFFCASDRMRSSNFRNSAVSSSMLLEGRFWKGITSDMVEPPLGYDRAARAILPAIAAFLRRGLFHRLGIRHNYFQIQRSEVGYRVIQHRASHMMYVCAGGRDRRPQYPVSAWR
jgi:hypothetical protein